MSTKTNSQVATQRRVREFLLTLLRLDPREKLIRKVRDNGTNPDLVAAISELNNYYPLPIDLRQLVTAAKRTNLGSNLSPNITAFLEAVFAQACHFKLLHETYREAVLQGLQGAPNIECTPEELHKISAALSERKSAAEGAIKEIEAAWDQKREPDTSKDALRKYDRSSAKVTKALSTFRKSSSNALDPKYRWASDPHSKNALREALGISRARFHDLLKKYCPQATARTYKTIPFDVVFLLLKSRLESISKAKSHVFTEHLSLNETLLNADPGRTKVLSKLLKPYGYKYSPC